MAKSIEELLIIDSNFRKVSTIRFSNLMAKYPNIQYDADTVCSYDYETILKIAEHDDKLYVTYIFDTDLIESIIECLNKFTQIKYPEINWFSDRVKIPKLSDMLKLARQHLKLSYTQFNDNLADFWEVLSYPNYWDQERADRPENHTAKDDSPKDYFKFSCGY